MGVLSVLVAAIAAFVVGAIWYGVFAGPWKEASGVPLGPDGKSVNVSNPMTYITALIFTFLVAGMMRHTFALSGIEGIGKGFL